MLIEVYSFSGQKIYVETVEANSVYLDLSAYPAGTYFLQATHDSEKQQAKIVLQ